MFQKLKDYFRVRKLRKLCQPGEYVREGYWRNGGRKHKEKKIWVRAFIVQQQDRNRTTTGPQQDRNQTTTGPQQDRNQTTTGPQDSNGMDMALLDRLQEIRSQRGV